MPDYFSMTRVLGFLTYPSNLLIILGILALVLRACGFRRLGRLATIIAIGGTAAFVLSPLGNMMLTPLEQRFPAFVEPDWPLDGIIVIGGSYDGQSRGYLSTFVLGEDTEPIAVMARLARRHPEARIIFSGGSPGQRVGEAEVARRIFISFGIAADRIVIEDRSRTTRENAAFSAEILRPKPGSRWLLVASAYHMPRAVGAFRRAGFDVSGYPVGWRTHGWRDFWTVQTTPLIENLRRVDIATHQWLGLAVYWLLGHSEELWPGPQPPHTHDAAR